MQRRTEVNLLPQAEEDLLEVAEYIALDNPAAAEKMLGRFEKAFDLLADNPASGRRARDERLKLLQYRFLMVDRYLVFYLFRDKKVLICRILHRARDFLTIL
jgi:toxin ParE1/3/4